MVHGKQIQNASIDKTKLTLTTPSSNNDPATKQYVDDQLTLQLYNQDWKGSVRVASTANVSISSAPSSIDGVTLSSTNRVLLKNQTTASENGIYVFNGSGSAMTRASDADASAEVTSGLSVVVEEGTANQKTTWRLATANPITLGSTSLTFEIFATVVAPASTASNKAMAASTTTSDFDQACSTTVAGTPAQDAYVTVFVNGVQVEVGDGVKTKASYFSADSGSTAKSIANIASGDRLYWVGSVAGYQLSSSTDSIDFIYSV